MSPPAITSPFTEPPQSFGTEGLNISRFETTPRCCQEFQICPDKIFNPSVPKERGGFSEWRSYRRRRRIFVEYIVD